MRPLRSTTVVEDTNEDVGVAEGAGAGAGVWERRRRAGGRARGRGSNLLAVALVVRGSIVMVWREENSGYYHFIVDRGAAYRGARLSDTRNPRVHAPTSLSLFSRKTWSP